MYADQMFGSYDKLDRQSVGSQPAIKRARIVWTILWVEMTLTH